LPERRISYYTTLRGPDILRIMIDAGPKGRMQPIKLGGGDFSNIW